MRLALIVATALLVGAVLLGVVGSSAAPLSRSCSPEVPDDACSVALDAVMRRGLPPIHPLIIGAHVGPGSAPDPDQLGHRATVAFDLLGVPGPTTVELHYDMGGHWGGVSSRGEMEVAGWTFGPLFVAGITALVIVGFAWRRSGASVR